MTKTPTAHMTSRERMFAALTGGEVDYVPCSINLNANLQVPGYDLRDAFERFRLEMDLGTEPVPSVAVGAPGPDPEAVETRTWVEERADAPCPILFKEFKTPDGALRHGIKRDDKWPHGDDIPWSDYTAGHCYEPLIKTADDVAPFAWLHRPPTEADLEAAAPRNERMLEFARANDTIVRGGAGVGLATFLFVMGAQNMVMFAVQYPEAFRRLAQIDHATNLARIRLMKRAGADFLKRFGGYEQTNFLSPAIFDEVVAPLLREEVRLSHELGLPIYYRVVTGFEPLMERIASLGFDCVEGAEPALSKADHRAMREGFGDGITLWTGVSSPVHLGARDAGAAARQAVRDAFEHFGRRRFILNGTNSIRNHWPWENTLAMVEEWKRLR